MESKDSVIVADEQILSVSNLEKFDRAYALNDDKSMQDMINLIEEKLEAQNSVLTRTEPIIRKDEDGQKPLAEMLVILKKRKSELRETNPSKQSIIIPSRIARNTEDTDSESDSSSVVPDSSESDDSGLKSMTPVSGESTSGSDETNSGCDETNSATSEEDSGSSDASSDDSAITRRVGSDANIVVNLNTSSDDAKNNEIIRNTMQNLNTINKIPATRNLHKDSSRPKKESIQTISSTLSHTNEIKATSKTSVNNDTKHSKPAVVVVPFDIDAARILNTSPWTPQLVDNNEALPGNNPPETTCKTINSTNLQDESGKYFTILHDLPRDGGGPCKKCPTMKFVNIKEWWKVQQNLAPRTRHSVRIGVIILGSALLLLAIFLLARLPHSTNDVTQPMMYDLPSDDAFRPFLPNKRVPDIHDSSQLQELQELPPLPNVDHPDVVAGGDVVRRMGRPLIPVPGADGNLEELSRRAGVAYHPELKVPVDETYLQMERARKAKLLQMASARRTAKMETILGQVRNTVDKERKDMIGKEKDIWAKGNTALRILLVSTWRSGSTFLGQVLQQHPGVFQHYEPFSYLGVRQVRSGPEAFQSQQVLHRLLDCRYEGQDRYLNYTKLNPVDMSGHNKRIWNACNSLHRVDMCSDATFLTESCNMFPIQLVKTVRLRLNLTQLFLGETRLNAKVVFLVRDPRATMSSRRSSVKWCDNNPDCSSPEILCSDLKADLKVSAALERLYPNSFTMVRYEDLANDPQNTIKRLLDFLGMEYSEELSQFVADHTESEVEKPWSIARKSAARVSRWKEHLSGNEIEDIEHTCKSVIETLGYEMVSK